MLRFKVRYVDPDGEAYDGRVHMTGDCLRLTGHEMTDRKGKKEVDRLDYPPTEEGARLLIHDLEQWNEEEG